MFDNRPDPIDNRLTYVTDQELALEYETNGIFFRIINAPAEEAVKHGFGLGIPDKDIAQCFMDKLEDINAIPAIVTAMDRARLFGGSVVVMFIDDGKDLGEPLDISGIHKLTGLEMYDRTQAQPDYTSAYAYNKAMPWKTGTPEYYHIYLPSGGSMRVHESRCLIFTNGELVSQSSFMQYQFWGLPEYYRIRKPLQDYMEANDSSPKMLKKNTIPLFKGNLRQEISASGEQQMQRRLGVLNRLANRFRFIGIDKNTEDITFAQAAMGGINEVLNGAERQLIAMSGITESVLFGRSASGLNATGKNELENWYSLIERIQRIKLKPNLLVLLDIITIELLFKGNISEKPNIKLEFNPLWSISEKEQADIKHRHAQTEEVKARTAHTYMKGQTI